MGCQDEYDDSAAVPVRPATDYRCVPISPLQYRMRWSYLATDDEAHMHTLASAAALGEIEVSVIRIRAEYRAVPHTMGKFRPVEAVHERSKKAGVHCVSYVLVHLRLSGNVLTR